ncbi:hypothetical protein [Formosa sp. PL04]|uniref:hypothetical protein n=1 Tax=Formosa sp. PL04 TaxID=3081755 RepID=UPI002982AAA1|nr:hypothetical protein [Formosa sp. PL04]MDW5291025.1 hypothetical protein [Formosa sp. PL04]
MKKRLFQDLFIKAEKQSGKNTKHGLSSHLENVFTEDLKFPVSKITFVRYYEKYVDESEAITNNPSTELLNKVSEFLNYNSYEDYVTKKDVNAELKIQAVHIEEDKVRSNTAKINRSYGFIKAHKLTIILVVLLSTGFMCFYAINKQHWMVWDGHRYTETEFDSERYNLGQLKLFNEDRISNFNKVDADCETLFFDSDGSVQIWYGKNLNKELEYFTSYGLHPETGKTLDPITKYMIKKYVCVKDKQTTNKH